MLEFGQVMAVVRLGTSHPAVPFHYTISQDGGVTWPKMQPMLGTGCARPRLAMLGDGYAPLLMSGGRMKYATNVTNASVDNLLWVDWNGAAFPATEPQWEMFALSYYHNLLAPPGTPKFTPGVNDTSLPDQTSAYTAVIPTGRCSAVVLYDLLTHPRSSGFGFSMRVEFQFDAGGEIGAHCPSAWDNSSVYV